MIIDKDDIDNIDINELRNLMRQKIKEYDTIKLEYDGKDIILADPFINELFQVCELLGVDNDIYDFCTLTMTFEYDQLLSFMKLRFRNMLSESFYNLYLLNRQLKKKYAFILSGFDAVIGRALLNRRNNN